MIDTNSFPVLPAWWVWTSVIDVSDMIQYGTSEKAFDNIDGIPILRMGNIQEGKLVFDKLKYLPDEYPELKNFILEDGDVLFNRTNSAELVGKTAVYKDYYPKSVFASYLIRVRVNRSVYNPSLLSFFINSFYGRKYIASVVSQQVGQANVNGRKLSLMPIPLPPITEQHRIVNRIEELFTKLDAGVEALKKVKSQLKRYRQSVLKHAFCGKLTEEWRKSHKDELEPASVLLEKIMEERENMQKGKPCRGLINQAPTGKDIGMGELPERWLWATVGELVDVGTGSTPLRSKSAYYKGGCIPWVTSGALNNFFVDQAEEFITELALKETKVKIFPAGSLLIALYGEGKTRGKISELRIDATTNQACAALLFNEVSFECKPYIKFFFLKHYEDIRLLSSGGVQPNLNLSKIKNTLIPLPPILEQHRIVEEIEHRLSIADQVEKIVDHTLKQSERLRQSILKSAFSGRLVPQCPSDEPAEELLKRIKEEKERTGAGENSKKKRPIKISSQ